MTDIETSDFRSIAATGLTWQTAAGDIIAGLGTIETHHSLGFIYVTQDYAEDLEAIEIFLRQATGIRDWIGCVGYGVYAGVTEFVEEPGMAVMITDLEPECYRTFREVRLSIDDVKDQNKDWLEHAMAPVLLVHADPTNQLTAGLLDDFADQMDGYLIGGLTMSQGLNNQFAEGVDAGGISGVMIAPGLQEIAAGVTKSCDILSPEPHRITACQDHVIIQLDHRPALDVLTEEVGDWIAQDLNRIGGLVFAGLPIPGNDQGDYVIRPIAAVDPDNKAIAITEKIELNDPLLFVRRDHDAAVCDMGRMLDDLKKRLPKSGIKGGLYISCAARGPHLFGSGAQEMQMIEEKLGQFPCIGFYANGEISRDRIHTHTGILALFV